MQIELANLLNFAAKSSKYAEFAKKSPKCIKI